MRLAQNRTRVIFAVFQQIFRNFPFLLRADRVTTKWTRLAFKIFWYQNLGPQIYVFSPCKEIGCFSPRRHDYSSDYDIFCPEKSSCLDDCIMGFAKTVCRVTEKPVIQIEYIFFKGLNHGSLLDSVICVRYWAVIVYNQLLMTQGPLKSLCWEKRWLLFFLVEHNVQFAQKPIGQ